MSKEDKPDAWMPLYIGDWDGDTAHLSCEEDGAYGRLVRRYWRHGAPPDDDAMLARIVRMDLRAWKKVRPALACYFTIADGVWTHKRVESELVRWANKKTEAVARAKAAAEARWGDKPRGGKGPKGNAPSMPQALPEQCPSSSPREVDGPTDHSTLSDRFSNLDLKEDRDNEREWAIDKQRAEDDLILARRQDPDRASELEEFIRVAKDRLAGLRRARLSVVAA